MTPSPKTENDWRERLEGFALTCGLGVPVRMNIRRCRIVGEDLRSALARIEELEAENDRLRRATNFNAVPILSQQEANTDG